MSLPSETPIGYTGYPNNYRKMGEPWAAPAQPKIDLGEALAPMIETVARLAGVSGEAPAPGALACTICHAVLGSSHAVPCGRAGKVYTFQCVSDRLPAPAPAMAGRTTTQVGALTDDQTSDTVGVCCQMCDMPLDKQHRPSCRWIGVVGPSSCAAPLPEMPKPESAEPATPGCDWDENGDGTGYPVGAPEQPIGLRPEPMPESLEAGRQRTKAMGDAVLRHLRGGDSAMRGLGTAVPAPTMPSTEIVAKILDLLGPYDGPTRVRIARAVLAFVRVP